jgi:hypothetical protein
MKLKLETLKPNPFKKEINGGKLDKEKVEKISTNFDKNKLGGLLNSVPVVNRGKDFFLVFGHHRIEALKQKFGKNYEVEVTIQTYKADDEVNMNEYLLRGMVVENLTQTKNEFDEELNNILLIYNYLLKNQGILHALRNSRKPLDSLGRKNDGMNKKYKEIPTANDISKWLDNETGKVMSHDTITRLLNTGLNLDKDLLKITEKKHNKKWVEDDGSLNRGKKRNTLNSTQASYLATFKDKQEQKVLAKQLMTTREDHVRNQGNLLSKYKELKNKKIKSEKEIKVLKDIKEGKKDIADLAYPIIDAEVKFNKSVEERFRVLRENLSKVSGYMEDLRNKSHDKKYMEKASLYELSETYKYLWAWSKNELMPFVEDLLKEINHKSENKGEKSDVIIFDFKEEKGMKGGVRN